MDRLYEFLALFGLGIVLLLCGCSSVRYVPQASTHDTLVKVNTVYKTQRVYDSVWVKEVVNHVLTVVVLVVLLYCLYYIKERKGKD